MGTDVEEDNDTQSEEEEEYDSEEYESEEEEGSDEDASTANEIDPAAAIKAERERKSAKEIEMEATYTDIEKKIIREAERAAKMKRKKYGGSDYSWWNYNDTDTFFTVSTKHRVGYTAGQQIFTSYGRRSNKFLLVFYGFCIRNNKHDSITCRLNRVVALKDKMSAEKLSEALFVDDKDLSEIKDKDTMLVHLKPNKLDANLMAYIRAQSLVMYKGDVTKIRMTEPVEVEYELCCLETYKTFVEKLRTRHEARFAPINEAELPEGMPEHRVQFIKTYRSEQLRIYVSHLSLVETCISILNRIHSVKNMSPSLSIAQHAGGGQLHNCVFLRKYFKRLFNPSTEEREGSEWAKLVPKKEEKIEVKEEKQEIA